MSAQLLRDAAKVLRERAEAATDGPWLLDLRGDGRAWIEVPVRTGGGRLFALHGLGDTAAYIATMDPTVGAALADLLDECAGVYPWVDPSPLALAVADAILGGQS